MRKSSKSLLSMILTAAMVVSLGAGVPAANAGAEDAAIKITPEFTAYLVQNNSKIFNSTDVIVKHVDGTITKEAGADDDTKGVKKYELAAGESYEVDGGYITSSGAISTTGTYSVEAVAEDDVDNLLEEASYLGVELGSLGEKAIDAKTKNYILPDSYTIKPKTITITPAKGEARVLDWAKNAKVYNDGNSLKKHLRMGVVNNYAATTAKYADEYQKANPFRTNVNGTWKDDIDPVEVVKGDKLTFTFEVTAEAPVVTPTPKPTAAPTAAPASQSYAGYLGFQTDNYIFRDCWNNAETGLASKGYKYLSQIAVSSAYDQNAKKIKEKMIAHNATIKDSKMTDNATYTVSVSGVNMTKITGYDEKGKAADKATAFNMLYVSTTIPTTMKGVSAVNATVKVDGKVVKKGITLPNKPDADGYYQFMVADVYSEDDGIQGVAYGKDTAKNAKGSTLKDIPTSSVEITYTLKGADFSGKDYATKTIGTKKGKTFTVGNFKYKVTKAATVTAGKTKAGKVQVVGLTKKGKKASKLSVATAVSGKKVTVNGSKYTPKYKISSLGKGAFKGAKAKSVTLSKNIKSIPASAFKNCKKLSKLTLKAKVSVKKGAFNGCKKTIKVAGGSKKVKKANLKKLKKSGYKKFK